MTFKITTSWDDGHILDLRVAQLLSHYQFKGTFYVARDYLKERMSDNELRQLAQEHELGAHTISHPDLTAIPIEQAKREIVDSKHWLEDIIGREVSSFCYPRGNHSPALQELVRQAGYRLARSTENHQVDLGTNHYTVPTTIQVYPYPLRPMPNIAAYRGWLRRLQPLLQAWVKRSDIPLSKLRNWQTLALAWAEKAAQESAVWHLWGHSWEIEAYQLWNQLESLLNRLRDFSEFQVVTNSELIP